MFETPEKRSDDAPLRLGAALYDLAFHPARTFLYSWNWKAALLSAILRAPIFLAATMRRGLHAISVAVLVEALYSAAVSGFYGACVQRLRHTRPRWASGMVILVILPALLLGCDYLLHLYTGMPNLKAGMLSAAGLSFLSSLFNWYLMSRGSLLVGSGRRSFGSDLKHMPRMVIDFVLWGPRVGYRLMRGSNLHLQA